MTDVAALQARIAKLETELAHEIAHRRSLEDLSAQLVANIEAIRGEHRGRVGVRIWTLYVCPSCKRHTTDPDQAGCDCDVDAWKEIAVARTPGYQRSES
jgi:hypothetical protein